MICSLVVTNSIAPMESPVSSSASRRAAGFRRLQMIHLAADDVPVTCFRRLQPTAEQ